MRNTGSSIRTRATPFGGGSAAVAAAAASSIVRAASCILSMAVGSRLILATHFVRIFRAASGSSSTTRNPSSMRP